MAAKQTDQERAIFRLNSVRGPMEKQLLQWDENLAQLAQRHVDSLASRDFGFGPFPWQSDSRRGGIAMVYPTAPYPLAAAVNIFHDSRYLPPFYRLRFRQHHPDDNNYRDMIKDEWAYVGLAWQRSYGWHNHVYVVIKYCTAAERAPETGLPFSESRDIIGAAASQAPTAALDAEPGQSVSAARSKGKGPALPSYQLGHFERSRRKSMTRMSFKSKASIIREPAEAIAETGPKQMREESSRGASSAEKKSDVPASASSPEGQA